MGKFGVCVRFVFALLITALLCVITTAPSPSAHAHACAPLNPPPISGSLVLTPATPGIVRINEVLSEPKSPWYCLGTYPVAYAPWIELYNPQDQAFDLYAVHAEIDSGPNSQAYYLPYGAAIAAHGFLVLFPTMSANTLTAGTTLRLVIEGITIDQIIIPTLGIDQSYARTPDGANSWQITNSPTIDANNNSTSQITTTSPQNLTSTVAPRRGSSYNSGSIASGNGSKKLVDGAQPSWRNLKLPATSSSPSNTTANSNTSQTATPLPSTAGGLDWLHLLGLSLLLIALAAVLFWCWRLFSSA